MAEFSVTILPQRLNAVRRLWLIKDDSDMELPSILRVTSEVWIKLCLILMGMRGLEELKVDLIGRQLHLGLVDWTDESELLGPLTKVTGVKDFEVSICWAVVNPWFLGEEVPFRLEERGGGVV